MKLKSPRLNGMALRHERDSLTYEAVLADLVLIGLIEKQHFELLTGRRFPESIKLPEREA